MTDALFHCEVCSKVFLTFEDYTKHVHDAPKPATGLYKVKEQRW